MMEELPFVVAAYGVILGGLAAYTVTLWRRLAAARRASGARDDHIDEAR
jgi:hypothetical protein